MGSKLDIMEGISPLARKLYSTMSESSSDSIFEQSEMQGIIDTSDPMKLMEYIQELMNLGLLKIVKRGGSYCYQAVKKTEADKLRSMSRDEALVYSYIEGSGRDGIWTKTIKSKTNLHQSVVQRCLKNLENKMHIKSVKSVKNPTRKIYMLANLQPSIELTGGPWFTDSELDSEFIESIMNIIYKFISMYSFPESNSSSNTSNIQLFDPKYSSYPTLEDIYKFVQKSGITEVDLSIADIKSLCDILIYDDKIETYNTNMYKLSYPQLDNDELDFPYNDVPCSSCSNSAVCGESGVVNPKSCKYFDLWT